MLPYVLGGRNNLPGRKAQSVLGCRQLPFLSPPMPLLLRDHVRLGTFYGDFWVPLCPSWSSRWISFGIVSRHHDSLLHQRYACHIINLIVKADIKEIEDQIHCLRYAISYLKSSNVRIAVFRHYCRHNCLPQRTFSLDVPTWWNLTHLMIKRVLPYKSVFTAWIHNKLGIDSLKEENWTVCTIIWKSLKWLRKICSSQKAQQKESTTTRQKSS